MKKITYQVTDPQGIHARPAGLLVKAVSGFQSEVTIEKEGKIVDAKKIIGVMSLGVKQGQQITINIVGPDEIQVASALEYFIKENL